LDHIVDSALLVVRPRGGGYKDEVEVGYAAVVDQKLWAEGVECEGFGGGKGKEKKEGVEWILEREIDPMGWVEGGGAPASPQGFYHKFEKGSEWECCGSGVRESAKKKRKKRGENRTSLTPKSHPQTGTKFTKRIRKRHKEKSAQGGRGGDLKSFYQSLTSCKRLRRRQKQRGRSGGKARGGEKRGEP